jgi:mono/diheme cytochrome c family protein
MRTTSLSAFRLAVALAAWSAPAAAQDAVRGEALFLDHCAACHGIEARGNGPRAPVLTIQPTDLTRLAAEAGGVFPLLRAARRIDGTDPLVSHGSPMPIWGPFFDDADHVAMALPDGQPLLVPRAVADLLAWLQTVQAGG